MKYRNVFFRFIKTFIILLFLILLPLNSYASKLDIYGYFQPQFTGISSNDDFYQLSSNKLRIDFKCEYSKQVTFGANYNFIGYSGKTRWNMLEYIPKTISNAVPANQTDSYDVLYEDDIILDNAYIKLSFKCTDITMGKQQISPGTGYAWNPTDVFNYKDLLDPTYEQPGHNAYRIDFPINNKYSIVLLYSPERTLENSGKLIRIKGKLGHFDYSLIGIEKEFLLTDYFTFDDTTRKRKILGGDFVGEFLGLGVWEEYAYNFIKDTDDFYESVTGIDYTFIGGTYFMCEYYRNTSGKCDYKKYDLNDWLQFITAQTKTISRDQIYASLTHPMTDLITAGTSVITSLNDGSLSLIPSFTYSLFENVDLSLFLNFNLGKKGSNYDRTLGNGGTARLQIYF